MDEMKVKKKLYKIGFKICDAIFPTYFVFPLGNKIKNFFATRFFENVGKNVNWGKHIHASEDLSIGDNSGIGNNAWIQSHVRLGNDIMIGPNVTIYSTNHCYKRTDIPMRLQGFTEPILLEIEDDVWIGDGVIILPKVNKIGRGSILSARSVVTKNVEPYSIVGGNPAKVIGKRK